MVHFSTEGKLINTWLCRFLWEPLPDQEDLKGILLLLYCMAVDLNSFICTRPFFANTKFTFANLSHTPANPTFIFRGVASIHFCAVETHSNSMQTATVSAIREKAKGRCKVVLGKFHQGIAEVHCLPHSLDLPQQWCCVGYWLPWTPSLSPLLSRNLRETFAKNPLQINRKIHTLNRGWGFSQLHLITIYI